MKTFVTEIAVLVTVCFIAGLILEGTRLEKSASKTIGIIITVSICISIISLIFNIKNSTIPNIDLSADNNYINDVNSYKLNNIKTDIINVLKEKGINNAKVYFSTVYEGSDIKIEKIHLDLTDAEYNSSAANINTLKEFIVKTVNIDKENILVYF